MTDAPSPRCSSGTRDALKLADDLEGLSQLLTKENTGSDAGFDDICWRAAQLLRGVAQGWQDISTAPHDGSKVDLWITPPKGALTTGDYGRVSDCWFSAGKWWLYDETKYASDSANCRSEVWNVTHWMPRPTPPVPSTSDGSAAK